MLKQKLHEHMYKIKDMPIEGHEVYNLCVPGATIADIERRFTIEMEGYSKSREKIIVVIELGGNDTKSTESPDNFVNTPENFSTQMKGLVNLAKNYTDKIVLIGLQRIDEVKNSPRINPITGKKSYWSNKRMEMFEQAIISVAEEISLSFVPISTSPENINWQEYLFDDGLHPNDKGHQWLFEKIWPEIEKLI